MRDHSPCVTPHSKWLESRLGEEIGWGGWERGEDFAPAVPLLKYSSCLSMGSPWFLFLFLSY